MITLPAGKPFNIETPSNSFKLNGETKSNGIYTTVVQSIVTFDDDQD